MVKCLLDTNVVSELRKKSKCDKNVVGWSQSINFDDMFISVLTVGEISRGIVKQKDVVQKRNLSEWLYGFIIPFYGKRIIDVNLKIMLIWGEILSRYRTLPAVDSLICATAIANDLILITRNTKDFKNIKEIKLFNPWEN